jgi:hypothetical protein
MRRASSPIDIYQPGASSNLGGRSFFARKCGVSDALSPRQFMGTGEKEIHMSEDTITKPEVLFTESPASWNTLYLTSDGYRCQLTLRGETGQEVLEKAQAALDYLAEQGCKPQGYHKKPSHNRSNGNGSGSQVCPIHQVEMRRREKDGRIWYSHQVGGQWCKGK